MSRSPATSAPLRTSACRAANECGDVCSRRLAPVDIFPANRKNVDMFPELKVRTGKTVDMFLPAIIRTGTKNNYLFHFLMPYRISCSVDSRRDVTMFLLAKIRIQRTVFCVFDELGNVYESYKSHTELLFLLRN